jgi:serine/threonine-protein kinase
VNTFETTSGLDGTGEADGVLAPGAMAGPWRVERELGRGGMGVVYAVVHVEIGKRAALKLIHRRLGAAHGERALIEARVVNRVAHPNIVDIFETGALPDGRPYIVMERLEGCSLAARARESKLTPLEVIAILGQAGSALVAAHDAGVIHRDLKTDNVFVVPDPQTGAPTHVKVLDWGIAKEVGNDPRHTLEGIVVGTPHYISPEQACGRPATDRSDVYSLGVVAFELFLDGLPFEAETVAEIMTMHLRNAPPLPRNLWPDIPHELEDLLLAMLGKDPVQRPCMRDVLQRLDEVAAGLTERRDRSGSQLALPTLRPVTAPLRRRTVRRAAHAVFGAAALALTAMLMLVSQEPEGEAAAGLALGTVAPTRPAIAANPSPIATPTPAPVASPEPVAPAPSPAPTAPVPPRTAPSPPRPAGRAHAPAATIARGTLATVAKPDPHPPRVAMRLAVHREPAPTSTPSSHLVAARGNTGRGLDPNGTLAPYP